MNAPIAFFCFNRADKTKLVLENLAKNDLAKESDIYIFCDGPRNIKDVENIKAVHNVIDSFQGFKNKYITKREINHGAQFSIIYGINQVLENNESLIVVEDDIITAPSFLKFTNEALGFYKNEKNIWCVSGFNYPKNLINFPKNYQEDIFFVGGKNSSWGWGTWKDRWQQIDFEIRDYDEFIKNKKLVKEFNRAGSNMTDMLRMQKTSKINAWDIQMSYAMFKNNGYSMQSIKPLTKNIGFDASGTHTVSDLDLTGFEFEKIDNFRFKKLSEIANNDIAEKAYLDFHRDPFFLIKWAKSKKKRRNFKWLLMGVLICEALNLLF
ncbi:MAG: hypothetical protein KGQ36_04650 [Rickettsiales bacterium]|nr:hypothetical protein [Rickettsiales bacterium]